MLYPYFLGTMKALRAHGAMDARTPIAGSSAGALLAAAACTELSAEQCLEKAVAFFDGCRQNGTFGRLGPGLTKLLDATLPEDIHERGRGRLHVGVTYLNTPGKLYKPELLSDFDSKQDVLDALLVSCHVPLWFDSRLITRHRGVWAFDGGFSDTGFIPMPPQADYVRGVRVCCFPNARVLFPDIDIAPDVFSSDFFSLPRSAWHALNPPTEQVCEALFAQGVRDGKAWAARECVDEAGCSTLALEGEDS